MSQNQVDVAEGSCTKRMRLDEALCWASAGASRPLLPEGTPAPEHAPHITAADVALVEVPADGLCLYHCANACADLRQWQTTHSPTGGWAMDPDKIADDSKKALEVRDKIVERASAGGDVETAARLMLDGGGGYPGESEMKFMAEYLNGTVALHAADHTTLHGHGPLVAQIRFLMKADGAGHLSPHFAVHQSWMPLGGAHPASPVGEREAQDVIMEGVRVDGAGTPGAGTPLGGTSLGAPPAETPFDRDFAGTPLGETPPSVPIVVPPTEPDGVHHTGAGDGRAGFATGGRLSDLIARGRALVERAAEVHEPEPDHGILSQINRLKKVVEKAAQDASLELPEYKALVGVEKPKLRNTSGGACGQNLRASCDKTQRREVCM